MAQSSISSDLIRGHIDTIILYSLLSQDKFAQQISDSIEEKSNKEYQINQATLYSSLKRLESLKYVSSYWNDYEQAGRRKFFHLTDLGKGVVQENLSSWSYSKDIIDKLMDVPNKIENKVVYVEKVVEIEKPITNLDDKIAQNTGEISTTSTPLNLQSEKSIEGTEDEHDLNFRLILNDLINQNKIKSQSQSSSKQDVEINDVEVQKFNATIQMPEETSPIDLDKDVDFTDLKIKAAEEGYKIKISSKTSAYPNQAIKINKVNFVATLCVFILAFIELMIIYLTQKSLLKISPTIFAICSAFLLVYPLLTLVNYLKNPEKTTSKQIHADSILSCFIVIFNVILIIFAIAFLSGVELSNYEMLLKFIIIPSILLLDSLIYYTIRFFISKSSEFMIIKNKK